MAQDFAKDEEYIKAAKLGIHAILSSYVLVNQGVWKEPISLKWEKDQIKNAVKEIKKK